MVTGARLYATARMAERYFDLGEKEMAKKLFAEGLRIANQLPDKTNQVRGTFAARLARVDLPAALAIAKGFPTAGAYSANWVLCTIAYHVDQSRQRVAETLELSHLARWRKIWGEFSNYAEMPEEIEPDPR
jgi:hypothetical protein